MPYNKLETYLLICHYILNCLTELERKKPFKASDYLQMAIWDLEAKKDVLLGDEMKLHECLCLARATINQADAPSSETLRFLRKAYELIGKEVFSAS